MRPPEGEPWTPEGVVEEAIRRRVAGVSFTYNEPTIWHEWALEACKVAKSKGLYTNYVTNAYIEQAPLDELGAYVDAYTADLKGWGQSFYSRFCHAPRWESVLAAISRAKNVHGMHVEVTTNVVPGWNDDDETLTNIAGWLVENLGPLVPWHLSRFIPHHKLSHLEPTPVQTLMKARRIGQAAGLKYVFLGNLHGLEDVEDSHCPNCNSLLIKRTGYYTQVVGLDGDRCAKCGAETGIVV
jgi:pyruvate formate lyase activating enzyme